MQFNYLNFPKNVTVDRRSAKIELDPKYNDCDF